MRHYRDIFFDLFKKYCKYEKEGKCACRDYRCENRDCPFIVSVEKFFKIFRIENFLR